MLLYSVRTGRNGGTFTAQYVLARTNLHSVRESKLQSIGLHFACVDNVSN